MAIKATVSMVNNLGRIGPQVTAALVHGQDLAAERAAALAVELSPWDQGTLAAAHSVQRAETPEGGSAVVVDTPYAARLHEHPEYNFSTDANPRAQGKWVEEAVVNNRRELGEIIRNRVRNGA